jgi:hypothetical protein
VKNEYAKAARAASRGKAVVPGAVVLAPLKSPGRPLLFCARLGP